MYSISRVWYSLITGAVAFAAALIFTLTSVDASVFACIISSLFIFAFAASLFFDESWVREVIFSMATKSINFPMLIWEFSIDGFIWLIAMKLLFWVVGVLAGILFAILGVLIGILISPIALPVAIYYYIKEDCV